MNTDDTDQEQEAGKADRTAARGKHDDVTQRVIGVFYEVYNELGCGFLESVYREAMRLALTHAGLRVQVEMPIQVSFRGLSLVRSGRTCW